MEDIRTSGVSGTLSSTIDNINTSSTSVLDYNLADIDINVDSKEHRNIKVGGVTFNFNDRSCSFYLSAPACKTVKLVVLHDDGTKSHFKLQKNTQGIFEVKLNEGQLKDTIENLSNEGLHYYYKASRNSIDFDSIPDPYAPGLIAESKPIISIAQNLSNLTPNASPKISESNIKIAEVNILNLGPNAKFTDLAKEENIQFFKKSGINTLQVMPCMASISENFLMDKNLENLWGYNILSMLAYDVSKFGSRKPSEIRKELVETINKLHDNGIQVILDLVTAHTSSEYSLLSILTDAYYHNSGKYDGGCYSGCGNSINANSKVGISLVKNAIWEALNLFDGVRLDQGSILGRDSNGDFKKQQKILRIITNIAKIKNKTVIFEDNDRAGHVGGSFPEEAFDTQHSIGWALGQFFDNRAVLPASKDPGNQSLVYSYYLNTGSLYWDGKLQSAISVLSDIVSGSKRIYKEHTKNRGIRILSSHDGFTTWDLSELIAKENNNDIYTIFKAQLASYLFSPGNIFIPASTLVAHSQNGNPNAYCGKREDAKLNIEAINIQGTKEHFAYNFISSAIKLRNELEVFNTMEFLTSSEVSWYGCDGTRLVFGDSRWDNDTTKVLQAFYTNKDINKPDVLVVHSGNVNTIRIPSHYDYEPTKIELVFDSTNEYNNFPKKQYQAGEEIDLNNKGVLVFKIYKN
jgi:pullulanase/glycogen debranching enzyme